MSNGSSDPAAGEARANGPIRVLLVEDDPGDVFLIGETLDEAPIRFSVESVGRLSRALERLHAPGIDVVLSDLTLPDSRGIETFRRLAAHPARVPVIVLSGLDDEELALETVEQGAQDYLVKGRFDQALLVRAIQYAVRRAEADRRLAQERNLLRSVIDNLPDSVYVKDAQGRYLLDNLAHMKQVGATSLDDVIGKTSFDFFPPETAAGFQADDQRVLSTGEPIKDREECVDDGVSPRRWLLTTKVPLRDAEGQIIGIVGIGRDITAAKNAQEQLAQSERALREKNAEMEDDLNMAREVQQAFLPQQFPSFPRKAAPDESALRFYSKYLPTATLGGDFFHVLPISDTRAGVFICDVMGHGVRAALITAIQRALVEELNEFADLPGEFLTHMNGSLLSILRRTRSPMFASAFYLVVDTAQGALRYANAGHPRPLHLHRQQNSLTLLSGEAARPGPALGVFEASSYRTHVTQVEPRDLIVLFTDGLYEVENPQGDFYDQQQLVRAVERRIQRPAEALFEETLAEVRTFAVSETFVDDVCLVGIEIRQIGAGIPVHETFALPKKVQ